MRNRGMTTITSPGLSAVATAPPPLSCGITQEPSASISIEARQATRSLFMRRVKWLIVSIVAPLHLAFTNNDWKTATAGKQKGALVGSVFSMIFGSNISAYFGGSGAVSGILCLTSYLNLSLSFASTLLLVIPGYLVGFLAGGAIGLLIVPVVVGCVGYGIGGTAGVLWDIGSRAIKAMTTFRRISTHHPLPTARNDTCKDVTFTQYLRKVEGELALNHTPNPALPTELERVHVPISHALPNVKGVAGIAREYVRTLRSGFSKPPDFYYREWNPY